MSIQDLLKFALENLWRTRLRTFLTILGVVIGIGALVSMVSFGTGIEKNVTDSFMSNDLFTSLTITGRSFDFKRGPGNRRPSQEKGTLVKLNDSLVDAVKKYREVEIAFPEFSVPTRLELGSKSATTMCRPLPAVMGKYKPYNELMAGKFFSSDSAQEIILSVNALEDLGYFVRKNKETKLPTTIDSGLTVILSDSLIGKTVSLYSASVNLSDPMDLLGGGDMFEENVHDYEIVGITEEQKFAPMRLGGQVIIPFKNGKALAGQTVTDVMDFLNRENSKGTYNAIYVRTKTVKDLDSLKEKLKAKNIGFTSMSDVLSEIKQSFLILDSILGIIGLISLIVAGFGIINTMLMSILERTREIGIMKAVGADDKHIRTIFFFEAAVIGLLGALGGIVLGWLITRVANLVVVSRFANGDETLNMFYFPAWLILGSIAFAIIISLLAGLYPAIRASRIDPVEALRQNG